MTALSDAGAEDGTAGAVWAAARPTGDASIITKRTMILICPFRMSTFYCLWAGRE